MRLNSNLIPFGTFLLMLTIGMEACGGGAHVTPVPTNAAGQLLC